MNVFELYADATKHDDLLALLTLGAQHHPDGLAANFLEKDIWVTETLRLLYEEKLIGEHTIAFKGGTALSKCWAAIERFSEDIDLSIHWADLSEAEDENAAWEKSINSNSQRKKFRDRQTKKLTEWTRDLTARLNTRFVEYDIDGLSAEFDEKSKGEKINIHFPRLTANSNDYQLDHVLLEFGGRNRGRPTITQEITCYLSEVSELDSIKFPSASVEAYDPAYILWEKLTALHQFCTQRKELKTNRIARHWYDVDCLLTQNFADPLTTQQAMRDVITMKSQRWPETGVDYELAARGQLQLIPGPTRLEALTKDHDAAVKGGFFFSPPKSFKAIIKNIRKHQNQINKHNTNAVS